MSAHDNNNNALTLSREGVLSYLKKRVYLEVFDCVSSTNTLMRLRAGNGAPTGTVIIASGQTAGRGRQGHSFHSPAGGLYMSLLLRPEKSFSDVSYITPSAAVAVCEAVEGITEANPQIKWVNDVFLNGKKICGILTEGTPSPESGKIEYAVIGIGLNVTAPEGGYPGDIKGIAGSLFEYGAEPDLNRLAADIITRVLERCTRECADTLNEYRSRSFLTGKNVSILSKDAPVPAKVLGIDDKYGLLLKLPDGSEKTLTCGEVSVRAQ